MSHAKEFNVTKNYSVRIYGHNLPLGALYGTYTGYSKMQPLKWVVTEFPQTVKDTFQIKIYSYLRSKWIIAPQKQYRQLYKKVCEYIRDLNLIGHKVRWPIRDIKFPTSAPYGTIHKITCLKQVNKTYSERGSSGHPIYGDMKRNAAGEREYRWDSPNTIIYGEKIV